MKYLTYLLSIIVLLLFVLFLGEYMDNHTYYFAMLGNFKNWMFVVIGFLISLWFVYYIFTSKKLNFLKIFLLFFGLFVLFSIISVFIKGGILGSGLFILPINFFILFFFYVIILIGSLAIGNLLLKKIDFSYPIYNFAVKLSFGFGILGILLFYLVSLGFLNVYVSFFILSLLLGIIYLEKNFLKSLHENLILSFYEFRKSVLSLPYIKYLYFIVFSLSVFYLFIGFNYTFIPYPTAWDANHAYMFLPKVFAEYGGYPWGTDFRPTLSLWSAFLAWVYNLGTWTRFAQDTWMISFNFISAFLSLLFSFILISTIVKLLIEDKEKSYLVNILGYLLIITWLSSGMGAFLVFVDNKTDLAVFMYVVLALFLVIYTLFRFKEDNGAKKIDLIFLAIAGFFFAIANLIKPTATFDFFESVLSYSIINIGFLIVIGVILFVIGVLSYLKFRGFDKAVDSSYSYYFVLPGFIISLLESLRSFLKNKIKIIGLFVLILSFIFTLIITKGFFSAVRQYYDKNLDTNPVKIIESLIMNTSLPVKSNNGLTGALYSGLKEIIGSAYNEDNTRYVGYGNREFGDVWWKFIVPSKFIERKCVVFKSNANCGNIDIVNVNNKNSFTEKVINDYTIKIFDNIDKAGFNNYLDSLIKDISKKGNLNKYYSELGIDSKLPDWKKEKILREKLYDKFKEKLLKEIKSNLESGKLNFYYNPIFQNDKIKEILQELEYGVVYESVSIPYRLLIPFNVTFNWSLQNLSSYYTDIGIIWLVLIILILLSLLVSICLIVYSIVRKDTSLLYKSKFLFAFSFASLVGWGIWLFVAEGIVWYNIGGLIWIIITTIVFVSILKEREYLIYSLFLLIFVSLLLNFIRISTQGGGQIQNWYKSSVGEDVDYVVENGGIVPKEITKIPYTFDDVFSLQFNMYKKPIEAFNNRTNKEGAIIGGTYMKYFVKNQNKIKDDQFLMYLWRLGSDNNVNKFYERLKDQKVKEIVLDPNIASVVMGTGNIHLWYRYFGIVDKKGNIIEKGVFTNFVDLANSGYLNYGYSNNLGIKYSLIYSDKELSKILNIQDLNEVRKIKYYISSLKFIPRMLSFEYPNSSLGMNFYRKGQNALIKIIQYRLSKAISGDPIDFLSDLSDAYGLNIKDYTKVLVKGQNNFSSLNKDEKILFLRYLSIYNQISKTKNADNIVKQLFEQSLVSRAQLMWVSIK